MILHSSNCIYSTNGAASVHQQACVVDTSDDGDSSDDISDFDHTANGLTPRSPIVGFSRSPISKMINVVHENLSDNASPPRTTPAKQRKQFGFVIKLNQVELVKSSSRVDVATEPESDSAIQLINKLKREVKNRRACVITFENATKHPADNRHALLRQNSEIKS